MGRAPFCPQFAGNPRLLSKKKSWVWKPSETTWCEPKKPGSGFWEIVKALGGEVPRKGLPRAESPLSRFLGAICPVPIEEGSDTKLIRRPVKIPSRVWPNPQFADRKFSRGIDRIGNAPGEVESQILGSLTAQGIVREDHTVQTQMAS